MNCIDCLFRHHRDEFDLSPILWIILISFWAFLDEVLNVLVKIQD
jgi:hypothetical protein